MKLYSLIKNINCRVFGNTNIIISGLFHKDIEVKENGLFFCLRGTRVDGNNYIVSAINNGAKAIVTEQEIPNLFNVTQIIVKNARETMSLIACNFYNNPAEKLKIIGVTGTNGKTTITTLLFNILSETNNKCALIGTNGIIIENQKFESSMTTPDPIELQKYFYLMVKKNIKYVLMEVSAHAIALKKIEGFKFEQVIFTNLTEDHLDFFKTMENYFKSKMELFSAKHSKNAIINIDDNYGELIYKNINIPCVTYSINDNNNNKSQNYKSDINKSQCKSLKDLEKTNSNNNLHFFASKINLTKNGSSFLYNNKKIVLPLFGTFNISNCLAVIASLKLLGYEEEIIISQLKKIKPVDGRFNIYEIKKVNVVIDYAHTPDGLKNALLTCNQLASGKKVVAVFGCGGNREQEKRKIMGQIASKYANYTIITTDNPRFENRETIAQDIALGFDNNNFKIILDREKAIKNAISISNAGDFVLIAGKGSEKYIDENGEKIAYSDYDVIKNLINKP